MRETLSLSANIRRPLSLAIHDPRRSEHAPAVPDQRRQLHHVPSGLRHVLMPQQIAASASHPGIPTEPAVLWERSRSLQATESGEPAPMDVDTAQDPIPGPSIAAHYDNREQVDLLARQRVTDAIEKRKPAHAPRKRRTCRKCALRDCPGSQKVSNCRNPCRDCGNVSCNGRNPKNLDKPCSDAWN